MHLLHVSLWQQMRSVLRPFVYIGLYAWLAKNEWWIPAAFAVAAMMFFSFVVIARLCVSHASSAATAQ
ncbi:MAG: hypothetical protein JNL98_22110 [Bryobacterales bacterium]|nr:hypothetical protein [Bryobacterales bacterium]